MVYAALFDHHRHDSVLVRFPPLSVLAHDLAYMYVAHEVASDKDKIGCDDPVCVYITHGIAWRERLFGSHNRDDLEAYARL